MTDSLACDAHDVRDDLIDLEVHLRECLLDVQDMPGLARRQHFALPGGCGYSLENVTFAACD
jgi:hypothetical protein